MIVIATVSAQRGMIEPVNARAPTARSFCLPFKLNGMAHKSMPLTYVLDMSRHIKAPPLDMTCLERECGSDWVMLWVCLQ